MMSHLHHMNPWAVLTAALGTFFLGAVWYQALFGKLWAGLHGYSPEKMQQMHAARPPALFFGGMIVAYLLVAFVMALLVEACHVHGWAHGALLGFHVWLGPAMAIGFTGWLASDKHIGIFAIDASFQLVFLILMGVILSVWQRG